MKKYMFVLSAIILACSFASAVNQQKVRNKFQNSYVSSSSSYNKMSRTVIPSGNLRHVPKEPDVLNDIFASYVDSLLLYREHVNQANNDITAIREVDRLVKFVASQRVDVKDLVEMYDKMLLTDSQRVIYETNAKKIGYKIMESN